MVIPLVVQPSYSHASCSVTHTMLDWRGLLAEDWGALTGGIGQSSGIWVGGFSHTLWVSSWREWGSTVCWLRSFQVFVPLWKDQTHKDTHKLNKCFGFRWQTEKTFRFQLPPVGDMDTENKRCSWRWLFLYPSLTLAFDRHSRWPRWHEWIRKEVPLFPRRPPPLAVIGRDGGLPRR